MKKFFALALTLAMAMSLVACGDKNQTTDDTVVEQPNIEETIPENEIPDVEDVTPENDPTQALPEDDVQTPIEDDVQTPTDETVQNEVPQVVEDGSIDLTVFYNDLNKLMIETLGGEENSPSMMTMDAEMIDMQYPGLLELKPKQAVIAAPMMSSVAAEFALVEANDADEAAKVVEIMNSRIKYMIGDEENPGAAWYPETIEQWEKNAKVVSNGNYVMLVTMEGNQTYIDAFNALFA